MHSLNIVILAAGQSSRMRGLDKLLLPVGSEPQLRRVSRAALATGCHVIVALSAAFPNRAACIADLAVQGAQVADPTEGIAGSIRAAAQQVARGAAVMIVPADMPALGYSDFATIVAAHMLAPSAILRGAAQQRAGHPVVIPADLVPELQQVRGDIGARDLIAAHADRLRLVALPGQNATLDLDTPEEWAEWLALTESPPMSGTAT